MEDIKNINEMPINGTPVSKPKKKKERKQVEGRDRFTPLTIFMLVVLTIYVLSMFYMIGWTFITSVKNPNDFIYGNRIGLPRAINPYNKKVAWGWNFWHYSYVYNVFKVPVVVNGVNATRSVGEMFSYALIYAIGCAFTNTLVPMLTAYLCARYKFFFSKIVHTIVIVTMILPIIGSLPSELRIAKWLGLYDELWGLWIMRANFLGMYFLIFYGNFKALPMAYTEAAKIDGAGNVDVLVRIIIPLVRNTFFTVFLLHFISYWNDYNTPLLWMPSYPTLAYGLYYITMGKKLPNDPLLIVPSTPGKMTAAMTMMIPILVLFLTMHKRLLGNLTIGGLKG